MSNKKIISFVIPCYKSDKTIGKVVDEIIYGMNKLEDLDYEIVLANDCSPSNLYDVLNDLADSNKRIKVIHMAKNQGQEFAMMCGLNFATGDYIVYLDDDGQCPVDHTKELIEPLFNGLDVSIAKYPKKKQSLFKNAESKLNVFLLDSLTEKNPEIKLSNFIALKKNVVEEIIRYKGPYPSVDSLIFRSTSKIINVPMEERERAEGGTTYTIKKLISLLFDHLLGFTIKPLRFAMILGSLFAIYGVLYTIFLIINRINNPNEIGGWTSLMVAILIIGDLIIFFLGLVGEYLGRAFMTINNAPQFIVRETRNIKLNKYKDKYE